MAKINLQWGETADSLFQRSIETESRRLRERYAALAMLASGQSAKKVAERIGRRRQTVSAWLQQFNENGPEGLLPAFRSSAIPSLTDAEFDALREALANPPSVYGFRSAKWRGWQIAEFINKTFNKSVHPETARRYQKRFLK